MKQVIDDMVIGSDEFRINVQTFMNIHTWSFAACNTDTILHLKYALESFADSSRHEMKLIISQEYPYPLHDKFRLHDLLESHRVLTLIIVENPSKVIPKRVLTDLYDSNKKDLLLTNIYNDDINYIQHWIVLSDNISWKLESVQLSWDHPFFCEILHEITLGLYSMTDLLSSEIFPIKYYLTGVGELDQRKLKELRYFYKKLKEYRVFHIIGLYISPGLLGNNTSEYIKLTKENTQQIDLILSSLIWDELQYNKTTLCLLHR